MGTTARTTEPGLYQIRVAGHLDPSWAAWFDGLTISNGEQGEATLVGLVRDQAALHGLLTKIRDLGLPLLSVNRVEQQSRPATESE
jgi:hypothetical protein